jgi:hypothetical protein
MREQSDSRQRFGRFALGLACSGSVGFGILVLLRNLLPYDASLLRAAGESVILTLFYLTPLTLVAGLIALRRWWILTGCVLTIVLLLSVSVLWPGKGDPVASYESSAVANLRTINTAEMTYLSSDRRYSSLADLIASGLLDSRYNGTKAGYRFSVSTDGKTYTAAAMPQSREVGRFGYYTTTDAVIRYATSKAGACSPCFPEGQSGAPVQ